MRYSLFCFDFSVDILRFFCIFIVNKNSKNKTVIRNFSLIIKFKVFVLQFICIRKMSELQDWKLKTQAVVKLCSKKCDKSVLLLVLRLCKMRHLPQYSHKTAAKAPKTNDLRVSRHILPVQQLSRGFCSFLSSTEADCGI